MVWFIAPPAKRSTRANRSTDRPVLAVVYVIGFFIALAVISRSPHSATLVEQAPTKITVGRAGMLE
jgi:hypothetical protein